MTDFDRLVEIMRRLLAPGGCPWDREQSLETLKPYLIEEAYEVLEAMDSPDPREHCEELGDLLFQVVFQSALRERAGQFSIEDVCRAIADKLTRRHPHVFAGLKVSGPEEVLRNWEQIKAAERADKGRESERSLAGVPVALPALARALRTTEKAARVGFDWPDPDGPRQKVDEELQELDAARRTGDPAALREELGDLLFALTNLARKLGCDPEQALRLATDRFVRRFEYIEDRLRERGQKPAQLALAQLDALWEQAKRALAPPKK